MNPGERTGLTDMAELTDGGPVLDTVLAVVLALLIASGAMVLVRMARGPSTLDRAVALEALLAVVMAGIGVQTAVQRNGYYLPALLVLSFLGFTGSVGVARFMALRDEAGSEDADSRATDSPDAPDSDGGTGGVNGFGETDAGNAGPRQGGPQ